MRFLPILTFTLLTSVTAMTKPLSILSYNICHGNGLDQKVDLNRTADVINRVNPDLAGLQEVDVNARRTNGVDEPAVLSQLTGRQAFFGKSIPLQGGEYGIAILATDPKAQKAAHFPLPGKEARSIIAVQSTTADGKPFLFACTHLDLDEQCRMDSVKLITDWAKTQSLPVCLVGDFNCKPTSAPYALFCKDWLSAWQDAPACTFPANGPKICIDHCFLYPRDAWQIEAIQVVDEPLASDHRPLLITVTLK